MDNDTLQRIVQWEQAHVKGNKKPLKPREYPPLRPRKDIPLEEITPMPLPKKQVRAETTKIGTVMKEPAEENTTITNPSSTDAGVSTSSPKDSPKSRKAYYESWDKFDVDQAMDDMDKKGGNGSTKQTTTADVPVPINTPYVDPAAANAEKEKGNDLFKRGQYQKAIEHYSASIALDPSNPVLPINRAMALLKLNKFIEAERDCTLGLSLDSKNVKALWRRGIARRSLSKLEAAKKDFEAALKIDPTNKAVKEELTKMNQEKQPASAPKASTASPAKASTPPTTATRPPAKAPVKLPGTEAHEPTQEMKIVTTTSSSSATTDAAPEPVISSKRVLIKEVEDDEDSELFAPLPVKKSASSTTAPAPTSSPPSEAITSQSIVAPAKQAPTPLVASTPFSPPPLSSGSKEPRPDVRMIAPTTTLDFQRDWKSYSKNNALLYQYIKLIPPETLSPLFKSSLESDYLSSMLSVFREFYIPSEPAQLLYSTLVNLAKVQRFDMTLMFMMGTDKKDLVAIFQHLSRCHDQEVAYSQQDLSVLASKYKTTSY